MEAVKNCKWAFKSRFNEDFIDLMQKAGLHHEYPATEVDYFLEAYRYVSW